MIVWLHRKCLGGELWQVWVNSFLFFPVPLQRKPTAPNDLRAPSKTKDTLHPPGRAGPRAAGGEFDNPPQILVT